MVYWIYFSTQGAELFCFHYLFNVFIIYFLKEVSDQDADLIADIGDFERSAKNHL